VGLDQTRSRKLLFRRETPASRHRENIREKYGLDKPWYQQYGKTMWTIVRHLDFGTSLRYEGQSVNTIIKRSLPVSARSAFSLTCWR
jgi:ABC-type dipeptide/oligopeptide/nickel transport system permease component